VQTVLVLVASTILGSVGWWLGGMIGTMTAFMLSTIGTGVGVYLGRWFAREYLP